MGMKAGGDGELNAEINVTPMVDVMLVLLIIFMITAPMMNIRARSPITPLTIQCAWLNRRGMSRLAASVDAAENPGIMSSVDSTCLVSRSNLASRDARWPQRVRWFTVVDVR